VKPPLEKLFAETSDFDLVNGAFDHLR